MLRREFQTVFKAAVLSLALAVVLSASPACADEDTMKLTIVARYPDSTLQGLGLSLRGNSSSLSWSEGIDMVHVAPDTWSLDVWYKPTDAFSVLAFKALVDHDTWMKGPNELVQLPPANNSAVTFYPWFLSNVGRYEYIRSVYSPQLGNVRDVVVYVPPSYDENPYKTYENILLMHDGQNLFNVSTSAFGVAWMCQDTVNALVAEGAMEEIIIVGVDNAGAARTDEYTYCVDPTVGQGGKADSYLDFLQNTIKPIIVDKYRVANDVPRWGILGSSLGGLVSCYAGWTRSQDWDIIGCMSSSFWWDYDSFNNTILELPKPKPPLTFYLDSGSAGPGNDDMVETIYVRKHLEQYGYSPYYYLDKGGEHNEAYWGARFHVPMTDLYAPKARVLSST